MSVHAAVTGTWPRVKVFVVVKMTLLLRVLLSTRGLLHLKLFNDNFLQTRHLANFVRSFE